MAKWQKGGESPNKNGRPKGTKNKVPPSKDIQDAILKQSLPTLQKLIDLRESGCQGIHEGGKVSEKSYITVLQTLMNYAMQVMNEKEKNKGKDKPKDENEGKEVPKNVTLFSVKTIEK